MTGDVVNLRLARKRKQRVQKEADAEANRRKHGRTKPERDLEEAERRKHRDTVDNARRDAEGSNE